VGRMGTQVSGVTGLVDAWAAVEYHTEP